MWMSMSIPLYSSLCLGYSILMYNVTLMLSSINMGLTIVYNQPIWIRYSLTLFLSLLYSLLMFIFITRYQHEALTEHETHEGNIGNNIIFFILFLSLIFCFFVEPTVPIQWWPEVISTESVVPIFIYGPKSYLILMEPEVPSNKKISIFMAWSHIWWTWSST